MNIYLVEPNCYGTSGTIVLAENCQRAKELYLKKYDYKYEIECRLLRKGTDSEFVCPDFMW